VQVKGTALRGVLAATEAVYGPSGLEAMLAGLTGEQQDALANLVPSTWYPIAYSAEVHRSITKHLGRGSTIANYRVGVEAARRDYGGVYRAVLWTMEPHSVLERMGRTWNQYNSEGRVQIERVADREARAVITGASGYHDGMWQAVAGRVEGALKLCGVGSVRVTVGEHDATGSIIDVVWTK